MPDSRRTFNAPCELSILLASIVAKIWMSKRTGINRFVMIFSHRHAAMIAEKSVHSNIAHT